MPGTDRSVRMGDVVDRRLRGSLVSLLEPAGLDVGFDLDAGFAGSSAFFLPIPKSPRTLLFFPGLLAFSVAALDRQVDLVPYHPSAMVWGRRVLPVMEWGVGWQGRSVAVP